MADAPGPQNPNPQSGSNPQMPGAPEQQTNPSGPREPTPEQQSASQQNPPPAAPYRGYDSERLIGIAKIAVPVIVVIAVIAIAYSYVINVPPPITTSTTSVATSFDVNGCQAISASGTYYIKSNITTSSTKGACLDVTVGSVRIVGEGHAIIGSGPFTVQVPSSYGILVNSVSGVSISNLSIAKFSYGVFLNSSNYNQLNNLTISNSTISGIRLYGSSYNQLNGDKVRSTVSQSGINITLGGNNTVSASSVEYNLYSGMSLANTTGNRISGTAMLGNPVDLVCSGTSSFRDSNKFAGSSCFTNNYCNFAYCSNVNNQTSPSSLNLASKVSSCGSIDQGGSYALSGDLNLADYLNTSLPQGSTAACILINSSNVYLTCDGHSIINSHYGVFSSAGVFNVTVSGCKFENDTYGIYLGNMIKFGLRSIDAMGNKYGVYIFASTDGNMTNITASKNSFGAYLNGTTYATLYGFHVSNNTYGISINNSTDVYIKSGVTRSNSASDLFCSANAYNSTLLSMQNSQCGSTDCKWATSCPIRQVPTLKVYPVTGCTTISAAGEYQLQRTFSEQMSGTCFNINASYVDFSCDNNTIISANGGGTAFSLSNVDNVTISNCRVNAFSNGFVALNTKGLTINSSVVSLVGDGFNISGGSGARLSNDVVTAFTSYGFSLSGINGSTVYHDHSSSRQAGYGFLLTDSFKNKIENNTANYSSYGIYINNSRSNWIYNNSVSSAQIDDYYCNPNSGGVQSQYGRVNYGNTKANCIWMVEIPQANLQGSPCNFINEPASIVLSQDLVYTYGDRCFSLYSNATSGASGTVINCAGHTVYSTSGGWFVYAVNSSATVENCVLIGFTNPISFTSKRQVTGISIINNTILDAANTSIHVQQGLSSKVDYNNITNSTNGGIVLGDFNSSSVQHNYIDGAYNGIYINDSLSTLVENNTVNSTFAGITVNNSQFMSVANNKITDSKT